VLWNFANGPDGADPRGALILGTDGNFYGTTELGGTHNDGAIFKLTPTGIETVVWSFADRVRFRTRLADVTNPADS
jgi:uncharacterized repeat protein (TIGR03803 family)